MKTKVGYFRNSRYTFKFIRELSSFIIAIYSIYLLTLLYYYRANLSDILSNPFQIALAIIALIFALLHSISWLYLMPKIVRIKIGGKEINRVLVFVVLIILLGIITSLFLLILI